MTDTIQNAFKVTPRQLKKFIIKNLASGLVPFVRSSPGMGKSEIVAQIAKQFNLELIDHRLSTSAPEDLSGLPHFKDGKASFAPFDMFPTENTPVPEGKQGWILFLDEFNSAAKSVQAAAYKLTLDRMVGQYKLHPKVAIVAAGNLATDNAITNQLGTAMQSRLIHYEMELSFKEWLEDVALARHYDSKIIAFLSYKPNYLSNFSPDHNEFTFACPRTWDFMNRHIKGQTYITQKDPNSGIIKSTMDEETPMFAGTIGAGIATEFVQFTKVYHELPNIDMVVAMPETAPIPMDAAAKFAGITHIIEFTTGDNFEKVSKYINRFTADFRVLFYRALMIQKRELQSHPAFRSSMSDLMKYLHD